MNFKKIFEMQMALDKNIHEQHNVLFEQTIDKKILALIVEIGEFANEIKPFKYWKKDKTIVREKVLEEFVDGIHFFSSLCNFLEVSEEIKPLVKYEDQSKQLIEIFKAVSELNTKLTKETLLVAFQLYMGIAKLVNITDEEINNHYISKNKINYERIANDY